MFAIDYLYEEPVETVEAFEPEERWPVDLAILFIIVLCVALWGAVLSAFFWIF